MGVNKSTKSGTKAKSGEAYECGLCGYRVVIDEACGCAEEHVFICCGKPMAKKPKKAGKRAAKKAAPKKK